MKLIAGLYPHLVGHCNTLYRCMRHGTHYNNATSAVVAWCTLPCRHYCTAVDIPSSGNNIVFITRTVTRNQLRAQVNGVYITRHMLGVHVTSGEGCCGVWRLAFEVVLSVMGECTDITKQLHQFRGYRQTASAFHSNVD